MAKRSLFKTLLFIGLGCFVLLLAVAISVPFWFKADRFRPIIEKQLTAKLHRSVKLGSLGLRMLPMPTLTVASVEIADDPAFGAGPLFTSKSAGIRVHFLPLLKKQVLIDSVSLNDGVLNLRRDGRKKLNLSSITDALNEAAPAGTAPAAAGGGWTVAVEIASLQLRNFIVNYQEAGQPPVAVPVELSLSGFGQRSTRMDLKVRETQITFSGHLDGKGLKGDFSAKPLQFQDLQPLLLIAGTEFPAGLTSKGALNVKGSADLKYDEMESATIEGSAEMKNGEIGVGALAAPFTDVNFTADVKRGLIDVKGLSLKLLQSQLAGDLQVKNWLTKPEMIFNLKSERLEVGEITAQLKSAAPQRTDAAPAVTATVAGKTAPLTASGTLEVEAGSYNDVRFTRLKGRIEPASRAGETGVDDIYTGSFSLGPSQIQDIPGADPLLTVKQAALRLQFWPLAANNFSIDEISLDDAVLNLRRDAKQRLNVSTWMERQSGNKSGGGKPAGAASSPPLRIKLARVNRMMLRAFLSATPVELPVTLTMTRFGEPESQLDGTLGASKLHFNGLLDTARMKGDFRLDPLVMGDIDTMLRLAGTELPAGLTTSTLSAGGSLDLPFDQPEAAQYKLNTELRGGTLALAMLTAPLTNVSLNASLTRDAVNLTQMSFDLLKSHLNGQAAVLDWRKDPAITFSLNADQLEIGDLVTLVKSGPARGGGSSGSAGGGGKFSASGNLTVANGGFGVFRFSDYRSQVQISPGLVHLNSIRARFFSGTLTADAKVMTQAGRFSFGSQLNDLDLASFMKAVAGSPMMTGTADAAANGEGPIANWQSFTGYAKLNARNGQISHFDLLDKINNSLKVTGLSQVSDKDLRYDSLTSDLKFGGGGARTDNILLLSQITDVRGSGDIKFSNRMDIRGTSRLTQSRSAEMVQKVSQLGYALDHEKRLLIPFTATGPADNPSVKVDAGALMAQAGKAAVKKQAEDTVKDFLGGLLGGKKKKSAP